MLTLNTEAREETGKNINNLRKQDYLPGIVYGKEIGSLPIKASYKEFFKIWKEAGEGTIINLKINKSIDKEKKTKEYPVLIREVQKDSLSGRALHVDFYQLPMDKEVEVTIPFVFKGEAPAEKEKGGVLIKNLHEVKIEALPKNLIPSIQVDLSSLAEIEDSIKIKNLTPGEGIRVLANPEEIIALVREVEEEKIEVAPEEAKPEEVEVIGKEKEEIEGEEGEEGEKEREAKGEGKQQKEEVEEKKKTKGQRKQ